MIQSFKSIVLDSIRISFNAIHINLKILNDYINVFSLFIFALFYFFMVSFVLFLFPQIRVKRGSQILVNMNAPNYG